MIKRGDETYRISTRRPLEPLSDSIRRIGLINPPTVIARGDGYRIVCGFRRIKACHRLSLPRVPVRLLPADTPGERCLQWAITDNTSQRQLNLVETSRALNKLKARISRPARFEQAAAILGLPGHPRMVDKILPICRFSNAIQEGILNGSLALPTALELGRLPPADGAALASIFQQLRLNLNRQREMLVYIQEIALREEAALADVYRAQEMEDILEDPELDSQHKARRLRACLRNRRFPALSAAETAFKKKIEALQPTPGITVVPPASFESKTYRITLTFESLSQLKGRLASLEAISGTPPFADLFDR